MNYWRVNDHGVKVTASGPQAVSFSAPPPPPPPPPGDVSPALVVEYVDASGVRHTTPVVDGETSITGVAPLLVQFDGSGSRCPAAYAAQGAITDEEAYAYLMGGYRIDYGEGSGTWTYPVGSSYAQSEDTGPPLFSHIYRTAGTHTARLKVRDALGNENTISLSVVVSAAPSATHIPVSAGSWPTFTSNTRYTLDAGGDYRSFGTLDTGGLHNIIFEKTGSGADPRIGTFQPDGRSKFSASAEFEFRASHIRLINIDITTFNEGQRGFNYVGVIGGLIRNYNYGGQVFLWHEGSNINRSNVRYSRGLFLESTEVRNENQTDGFIIFGDLRGFHGRNTQFRHMVNGGTTWLMLRVYGAYHTLRNCFWYSEANGGGSNGLPLAQLALNGLNEVAWRDDDTVGPITSTSNGDKYGYIAEKQVAQHNQFYADGSFLTNGTATVGGGNPSGSTRIYPRLGGMEDNVWFPSGDVALSIQTATLAGQYMYWRNNRRDMGAGSQISSSTAAPNASVGDSVTYHGPFFVETTNTRPVPTAF